MVNPVNNGILVGTVYGSTELKTSKKGKSYLPLTLQVRKGYAPEGGKKLDFINVMAFNKTAEFISKYFSGGDGIVVNFTLSPNKQVIAGKNYWQVTVIANSVSFLPFSKSSSGSGALDDEEEGEVEPGFEAVDDSDDELPF